MSVLSQRHSAHGVCLIAALVLPVSNGGRRMPPISSWWGVRTADRWLDVEWATGETELYDLAADPRMLQNVSRDPAYADVRSSMAARLTEQRPGR